MEPVQWFIFGLFISKHMKAVQGEHEFDKWYTNFPAISVGIKKRKMSEDFHLLWKLSTGMSRTI